MLYATQGNMNTSNTSVLRYRFLSQVLFKTINRLYKIGYITGYITSRLSRFYFDM